MASIRPATPDDLPAIVAIHNATMFTTTGEWTEVAHTLDEAAETLDRHRSRGEPVLVAVDDDIVVGWASYGDFRDSVRREGYRFVVEHSIHVAESHWGAGIGRSLIDALLDAARIAGKRTMIAAIGGENIVSIDFHRKLGFIEVARMPRIGEKFGRPLDLVLLQLDL
jgi:L-amino acid N-acyltransferase YncA